MEENKLSIQNAISNEEIRNLIYTIRGKQVMLDSDVARLFKYQTKDLNRYIVDIIKKASKNILIIDNYIDKCFGINKIEDKEIIEKIINL